MASKTVLQPGVKAPSKAVMRGAQVLTRPDAWAVFLELKVDSRFFTTKNRKYIVGPIRDSSEEIIIKKAAQMGFTIGFILKALHNVTERHWNGMYLLPFKQGARTFVQGRIDPVIKSSPRLSEKFSNVANVLHKQTDDSNNLYIRGTNVATDLREVPVDFEIWDERDKFIEENLEDALARMDGSSIQRLVQLSTPTAPGIGIDADDNWRASDQCQWEIPCPHCNRYQVLKWDSNVKIGGSYLDTILECSYCHKKITDEERWEANNKGRWVPTYLDGEKRGYHISQLNSPVKPLRKLFRQYFASLTDAKKARGFATLALGETYAGKGDKFTESLLDDCRRGGVELRAIPYGPIFIGVDQGAVLHCKCSYVKKDQRIAWDFRIFRSWKKLEEFLDSLHNFMLVIDAHPEKTKAKELAQKYKGRVWLGFEKDKPNQSEMCVFDEKKMEVSIDRTMAFDQYIWDHERGKYVFPLNIREIGEVMPRKNFNGFYAHHFEMVRVPKELADGTEVVRWEKTRNPDHWHHAGMFELIAMQRKPKIVVPGDVLRAVQSAGGFVQNGA